MDGGGRKVKLRAVSIGALRFSLEELSINVQHQLLCIFLVDTKFSGVGALAQDSMKKILIMRS